jgi:hypothetical protein
MADVFISYSRHDRNRVRLIAEALAVEGFTVWWDPKIKPGTKWNALIRRELEGAACVVTCWTRSSAKSEWVLAETTAGANRRVPVPLMLQRCEPPIPFNMTQSADLTQWRGDGRDPERRAALERIRALVEQRRRMVAAAPPPGEAHGAEYRGGAPGGAGAGDIYTPGPSRMGPRIATFLIGTGIATLLLTGGVWGGLAALDYLNRPQTEAETAAPPAPTDVGAPAPSEAATETPADTTPAAPQSPAPTPPRQNPAQAPEPTATAPEPPASSPPRDDPRSVASLDDCANRLAALCPNASGTAPGFRSDGRLSELERAFLRNMRLAVDEPIDGATSSACLNALQQRQSQRASRNSAYTQACAQLDFPTADPPPSDTPRPQVRVPIDPGVILQTPPRQQAPTSAPPVTAQQAAEPVAEMDRCLNAMARACTYFTPSGYPQGYRVDGQISPEERRLLNTPEFPNPGQSTDANIRFCESAIRQGQGGDIPSTPLARACYATQARF